jgi:hypothetical protein
MIDGFRGMREGGTIGAPAVIANARLRTRSLHSVS